jgi:hypothetical protein
MFYYPIVTQQGADVMLPRKPHICNNMFITTGESLSGFSAALAWLDLYRSGINVRILKRVRYGGLDT